MSCVGGALPNWPNLEVENGKGEEVRIAGGVDVQWSPAILRIPGPSP
jgi:hypothetical protein